MSLSKLTCNAPRCRHTGNKVQQVVLREVGSPVTVSRATQVKGFRLRTVDKGEL